MSRSHHQSHRKSPVTTPPTSLTHHFNIRNSIFKPTLPQKQNLSNLTFKRKHQKYFSCECSPDRNPLLVKKETLKDRNLQLVAPHVREPKVKMKQKTECFNTIYIKRVRLWKQTIDWVRYNIQIGIYALLSRLKTEFNRPELHQNEYEHITPELLAIHACVKKLQKFGTFMPALQMNGNTISKILKFENYQKQKTADLASKNLQSCLPKQKSNLLTKTEKLEVAKFKQAINNLNSALCLLSRKISIDKQNKLVKDFIEQNSHQTKISKGSSRLTPQKVALLYQVLQINARRCSILNDLATRIADIDQFKLNVEMSQQQITQLQSLNLLRDLQLAEQSQKDEEIHKLSQTVQLILHNTSQLSDIKIQNRVKTKKILKTGGICNQQNKEQPRKGVRIATKTSKSCRASIELLIDQIQPLLAREKMQSTKQTKQRLKSKSKMTMHYPTNHELKLELQTSEEPRVHFYQPKLGKKKDNSRPKLKKALVFAHELSVVEPNPPAKSEGKSAKSILMKKKSSKQKESGQFAVPSSNRFVSIKSLKSMKSMRSITSNGSFGSNKLFSRSLKTQREIKFLNSRMKKISAIRPYRSKLFKLNEDLSNGYQTDIINFATQFLEASEQTSSKNIVTSLNNLINQESVHNLVEPEIQIMQQALRVTPVNNRTNIGRKATLIFPSPEYKKTIKKTENVVIHRKSKKPLVMREHNDEKSNAIRNFLSLCSEFKNGKQILQNKKTFYQHFERLYQNKLIDQCLYQKFRKYFNFRIKMKSKSGRVPKLTTEQDEQETKKNSPYQSLISLRKHISDNKRLSQINQYYYNLDKFKAQQEQIDKTKQKAVKDNEFFKIRYYVDQKEEPSCQPSHTTTNHFNARFLSQDNKLQQKEL